MIISFSDDVLRAAQLRMDGNSNMSEIAVDNNYVNLKS